MPDITLSVAGFTDFAANSSTPSVEWLCTTDESVGYYHSSAKADWDLKQILLGIRFKLLIRSYTFSHPRE